MENEGLKFVVLRGVELCGRSHMADSDVTWGHRSSHDGDISMCRQCSRCETAGTDFNVGSATFRDTVSLMFCSAHNGHFEEEFVQEIDCSDYEN